MNRYMIRYRSSTGPVRLHRLAASLLCIAALVSSCVSSPAPEAEPDERPAIIEGYRLPAPRQTEAGVALAAPEPPRALESLAQTTQSAPPPLPGADDSPRVDVTVLSRIPGAASSAPRGSMDEPLPPPVAARAAPPAAAPVPAPAPATQRTTPAAPATPAPRTASPAPAAPSPAPAAPVPATPAPATQTTPAPVTIPSPPPSTQRSVQPVEPPKPDRQIEATRNQRFEIRLLGSGWTYLGDEDGKDGLRFETRRFEGNEAVFTLRPERSDDYLLRFQRNDPVSGERETILAKVSVRDAGQAPSQAQAATQPTAPSTLPAAAAIGSGQDTGAGAAPSPEAAGAAPLSPAVPAQAAPASALASIQEPDALLAFARSELDARRVRSALDALDRYVELFRRGSDELFYLYGLAYEQDTPFRDIKKAHENYKRVRDEYPRSPRWRAAAERVVYLERHFYGLR